MSWKKNGFSYVTWFLYLLIAGTGLFCLISAVGSAAGLPVWAETGIFGASFAAAGLIVFLLHRYAPKYESSRRRIRHTAVEALLVVLLVAAGLFLRVRGIGDMAGDSLYFDLASLESAKQIPQFAHGAVYFYLRLLHTVFFFFGNELLAAAWFQILAQTAAFLLLYLAARHLAGSLAALIMLGFCELSSYMINSALTLSPDCLYLLFWAASLIWIVSIRGEKLDPVEFFPVGIFAALMGYVDVTGFLLLFLASGVIFSERGEEEGKEGRKASFLVCLGGTILFFFVFLFLDSVLSKKSFVSVLAAWFQTYRPEAFRIPVAADGSALGYAELFVLIAFLLIGVFSFWRDGKGDSVKGWMVGVCIVILGECFGIFTEEVPAATYLFILLALLAGIGIYECFRGIQPGMSALAVKPAGGRKPDKEPGEKTAGSKAAGANAAGIAAAGMETVGINAAGIETAGMETLGIHAAGEEEPGGKKAKQEKIKQEKIKKEKAEETGKQRPSKGKADKKGGKSADERETPTVRSEDVAAALFGGGAAKGARPAASREDAAGGGGAPEEKKAGGVKSEDVAAALFGGGKPSAPKPPADEPTVIEQDATGERHFDGSAVILDQLTAVGNDAGGEIRERSGTNGAADSYGTDRPASEGYGTAGTTPEGYEPAGTASEGYGTDRPASGGYGTARPAPEGYEPAGTASEGYGTDRPAPEGYGTAGTAPGGYGTDRPAADEPGADGSEAEPQERPAAPRFIENPLPLPKKHEKRQVEYKIKGGKPEDDYDYFVAEDDDFDI